MESVRSAGPPVGLREPAKRRPRLLPRSALAVFAALVLVAACGRAAPASGSADASGGLAEPAALASPQVAGSRAAVSIAEPSRCQFDQRATQLERHVFNGPPGEPVLGLAAGGDKALVAYHPVPGATRGIVWLGGADGGLDGPFDAFYTRLAKRLGGHGVASVRLDYRAPMDLESSVAETMLALAFLAQEGICEVALVGFSFGGAVAIDAAAQEPQVRAVVTLSSQGLGTDRVGEIAPRPILIVYPAEDDVVPAWASEEIFDRAGEPKELVSLPTSDHYLTDVAADVEELVVSWLRSRLGIGAAATARQ